MMGHNQGIRESRWRRNNPRNYQQNQQQVQSSKRLKCHKINTFHTHTHTHAHSLAHPSTLTLTHTCKLNREAATGRQHQAEQGGVGQAVLSLEVLPRGKTA